MEKIRLRDAVPVASGGIRDVYRHPDDPALLIKVVRLSTLDAKFGTGRPWYKLMQRRYRHLISYLREIREHIAQHAMGSEHPYFLQRIVGLAETDLGLGLVVEAAFGRDGKLAPTVLSLLNRGPLDPYVSEKLDRFLQDVVNSTVIIADFHLNNVVYAYSREHGDHFVLIDGVGHKTLIPLERASRHLNRWSNILKTRAFRAKVEKRMNHRLQLQTN
jgi:hypothetical protein